jgi:4-amino-4-deoxy-L-arabinose transferase-like glycosyltransferase
VQVDSAQFSASGERNCWWREPEVAILILLVAAAYFVRIDDLSMRGEEPRRAQVAFEILQRGDWIVPREQGEPFLSRPPFQNWLIAASATLFDTRAAWAVRLPSVLAMLFTTLLIYGYARTGLTGLGALASGVAFATFAEMFTIGEQAETEMVFISLVSSSLIMWHWGMIRGWPAAITWVSGYTLMALAVLCKGPQPPVYFVGAVVVYSYFTGRLRDLFTPAHLLGALVGTAIISAWLIPCLMQEGWSVTKRIIFSDTGIRFQDWEIGRFSAHLVQYPLEVIGCTLPWSLLLLAFVSRDFRRSLVPARSIALFMGIAVLVAFPTCWIPPDAQTRYFTPLYPCLAVLVGVVIESAARSTPPAFVRVHWQRWTIAIACVMLIAAAAVTIGSAMLKNHAQYAPWAEHPVFAILFAVTAIVLGRLTLNAHRAGDRNRVRLAVLAVAAFMVLMVAGIATNIRIRRSEDQAPPIAQLKEKLPSNHRMVSLGHIDALFAYYYAGPIEPTPWAVTAETVPSDDNVYFCFDTFIGYRPSLPFAWDEVTAIPMDRYKYPPGKREVVIGKRHKVLTANQLQGPARGTP